MRKPPPVRAKGGKGSHKPRARRFRVTADLGNGKAKLCWFVVSKEGVSVRAVNGRRTWWLPLRRAAEIIAVRAQVEDVQARLGTADRKAS